MYTRGETSAVNEKEKSRGCVIVFKMTEGVDQEMGRETLQ